VREFPSGPGEIKCAPPKRHASFDSTACGPCEQRFLDFQHSRSIMKALANSVRHSAAVPRAVVFDTGFFACCPSINDRPAPSGAAY
jgi:hypothetical protein